jgi:hypothetical protein
MIREVFDEAREIRREMPAFTACVLLLIVLCIGVRGAIFCRADGESLRLIANRTEAQLDPIRRMDAQSECPVRVPGVTVIVGLRDYSMELSVPAATVHALLRVVQPDSFRTFAPEVRIAI